MSNNPESSSQLLTGFKAVVDRLENKDNGILKNHPNSFISFDNLKAKFIDIKSAEDFKQIFKGMCLKTLQSNLSFTIVHKHALRMYIFGMHVILDELAFDYEEDKRPCTTCKETTFPDKTLLCDCCNDPYHTFCLRSPMDDIPQGTWFCSECSILEQNYLLQKALSLRERKENNQAQKTKSRQGRTITVESASSDQSEDDKPGKRQSNKPRGKPTPAWVKNNRRSTKKLSSDSSDSDSSSDSDDDSNDKRKDRNKRKADRDERLQQSDKKQKTDAKPSFFQKEIELMKQMKLSKNSTFEAFQQKKLELQKNDPKIQSPQKPSQKPQQRTQVPRQLEIQKPKGPGKPPAQGKNSFINSEVFENIKKIVGRRFKSGRLQYKIFWADKTSVPSWIYKEEMRNCEDLVGVFESKHAAEIARLAKEAEEKAKLNFVKSPEK
jgi:hypothetical protein